MLSVLSLSGFGRPWGAVFRKLPLIFSFFFRCHFWWLLGRFSFPTCLPKSIKIHQKSMPRGTSSWASNFNEILSDFYSMLQSSEGLERPSGTINIIVLWLLPLSLRNLQIIKISSQMRSKKQHLPIKKSIFSIQVSIFKGIKNSSDVGIDFCAI